MAIYIKRKFVDDKTKVKEMWRYHNALVGSPAYKNGEIAIVEEGANEFTLCIGMSNIDDIIV